MRKTIPAISIIIPMYNVEKYVGECLDSILAQTFDDYEVIVVDDCSTDKSVEVVEGYVPKFDGKLRLIRSKKNSGGHVGIPRNTGLRLSIGEYVYFMDSDDAIVGNALESLYNTAEKFKADVVHCDKCFKASDDTVTTDLSKLQVIIKNKAVDVSIPTVMTSDLTARIDNFVTGMMRWEPWSSLINRSLLMNNDIKFPSLSIADDLSFFIMVLLVAEKFLLMPDALYVWRVRDNSNCRVTLSIPQTVHKKVGDVFLGVKHCDDFMNRFEIFLQKPQYKQKIFNFLTNNESQSIIPLYTQKPTYELDGLVRNELEEIGNSTALTAFLFGRMNFLNVQLIRANSLLRQQLQSTKDFQQQQAIIKQQVAQIEELKRQLNNVHDVFK